MTRMRNGRNSKVMLFNHEQGPKTVSPISLNDDTQRKMQRLMMKQSQLNQQKLL